MSVMVSQITDNSIVRADNKEKIKAPRPWLFVREIYKWLFLTKGQ